LAKKIVSKNTKEVLFVIKKGKAKKNPPQTAGVKFLNELYDNKL
jgi:hypothetical protein